MEPLYFTHGVLLGDAEELKTNVLLVEKLGGVHKFRTIWGLPIALYFMESMAGEK